MKIFMRKFDANGNFCFQGRAPLLKEEQKKIVDVVKNLRRTNAAYRDRTQFLIVLK